MTSAADLAGRRLMIGTPMYEGLCHGAYTAALVELTLALHARGVPFRLSFIVNQASPDRGRALIADDFLRSDCTHLLFIDADVVARTDDVLALLALQDEAGPYDVIGGSYPRKSHDWQAIHRAAQGGTAAGDLARFGGDIPIYAPGAAGRQVRLDQPLEAECIAGGYAMIRRATYERLIVTCPEIAFVTAPAERAAQGLGEVAYAFHAPGIDPVTKRYLSEDFAFCGRVRAAGMKVWLAPWVHADHIGNHRFTGTLIDAARLRSAAPA